MKKMSFDYLDDDFTFKNIQIAICIDATGSMGQFIEQAKNAINDISSYLSETQFYNPKFGLVAYRDHPPEDDTYVVKLHGKDFVDAETLIKFINDEITADGGGDNPEAVLAGLDACANKLNWREDAVKFVFHICDAPPHGNMYNDGCRDGFPNGCPDGHTASSVAKSFEDKKLNYVLLECRRNKKKNVLKKMKHIFENEKGFCIDDDLISYKLKKNFLVIDALTEALEEAFENEKDLLRQKIREDLDS